VAGYTPVFDSVFQGTLCGKYPDLPVWLVLLAMQQRGGIIDAHPSYIATISGLPQKDIEAAIGRFCEPDPASRTPDNEGRRLAPLEGRGFGWKVLNHEKYRDRARKRDYDEKRTESGADAERKAASRRVPTSPDESRQLPLSEAEAEAIERGAKAPARASKRVPEDFQPDREYALKEVPDMDVDKEIEKFRDCEFKQPHKDWSRVWRRWVRTCRDDGRYAKRANRRNAFDNAL
jgi:hypothetical protein